MKAQTVLWSSLFITLVGSYGCDGKNETNKRTKDGRAKPNEVSSTKKEDVSFSFALPRHFEEDAAQDEPQIDQDEISVGESDLSGKFMDFFLSKHIKVSCADETLIDFINIRDKRLRGILEVSLVQVQYDNGHSDYYDEEEEDKEVEYVLEDEGGIKYQSFDYDVLLDEDEIHSENWTYLETISVPFVCNTAANIKITNLDPRTNYRVDARLYSKHKRLKYTGSTEEFDAASGPLQLVMQKRRSNVEIEVVFENDRKPKN